MTDFTHSRLTTIATYLSTLDDPSDITPVQHHAIGVACTMILAVLSDDSDTLESAYATARQREQDR